jgi:hypothetical protein
MSVYNKREKEKEVALFFCNSIYWETATIEINSEDEESDCTLKLDNEVIGLQIVTCGNNEISAQLEAYKQPKEIIPINWDPIVAIIDAISHKNSRYSVDVKKKMFLLVHNEFGTINHEYLQKQTKAVCENSGWKWIFHIILPDNDHKSTYPKNHWDIIQLK